MSMCEVTVLYSVLGVSSWRSKVHCENDQGKNTAQVMQNKSVRAGVVLAPANDTGKVVRSSNSSMTLHTDWSNGDQGDRCLKL